MNNMLNQIPLDERYHFAERNFSGKEYSFNKKYLVDKSSNGKVETLPIGQTFCRLFQAFSFKVLMFNKLHCSRVSFLLF